MIAVELTALRELRQSVRRLEYDKDGKAFDARCSAVSTAIEDHFGWKRECGYRLLPGGDIAWVHCWNRASDGTIVDATADQFGGMPDADVLVIEPGSPLQGYYLPGPPARLLRWSTEDRLVRFQVIEDGELVLSRSISRQNLTPLTWDLLRLFAGQLSSHWVERASRILVELTRKNGSVTEHDFRLALDRTWFEEADVAKRNWLMAGTQEA